MAKAPRCDYRDRHFTISCGEAVVMMHRTLGAGLFAIGLLLGSTAMTSAQTVLVRGNDTDPATLDHHKTSTISEARIMLDLYDGLVTQAADGELIAGRGGVLGDLRGRADLHLQAAPGRQVVERRSGHLRRLPLRLPADHGPGDRRGLRQHPLPDPERRGGEQGRDDGRGAGRRGARPADAGLHAGLARRPTSCSCSRTRPASRCTAPAWRSSAPSSPSRGTWSRTAPTCWKASCRTTRSSWRRTRTTTTPPT